MSSAVMVGRCTARAPPLSNFEGALACSLAARPGDSPPNRATTQDQAHGTTSGIAACVGFSFLPGPPESSSASAGDAAKRLCVPPRAHHCGRSAFGSTVFRALSLPARAALVRTVGFNPFPPPRFLRSSRLFPTGDLLAEMCVRTSGCTRNRSVPSPIVAGGYPQLPVHLPLRVRLERTETNGFMPSRARQRHSKYK